MSCVFIGSPKPSQKTRNESALPTADVVSTALPTPISGTAMIVVTPDGIHAAALAVAHGVYASSSPRATRTSAQPRPAIMTQDDL